MATGIVSAIGAFFLWGLLPLYWKALQTVPPLEILCHRMVWSLLFVFILLGWRREWGWLLVVVRQPRLLGLFLGSGLLLGFNWLLYIWAVTSGYILETSLGYFINPLLNVLLGVIFLGERPRPAQWLAIGIAGAGVGYLTLCQVGFPWLALSLAALFGFYGLLKKTSPLPAVEGLSLETMVLFLPALGYLLLLERQGQGVFAHGPWATSLLLAGSGVATALPLLLFTYAAPRVTMINLGLLQYLAPTMQFMIGLFLYHEPFSRQRLLGFAIIWAALLLYSAEGVWMYRRRLRLHPR